MQKQFLTNPQEAWDVRFLAIYHDDDAKLAESSQQLICGKAMTQYWDVSEMAGSKTRSSEPFSEPIPELECLAVVDSEPTLFGTNPV